jgi:hypothetical protein
MMAWFSLWAPLALQLLVPLVLVGWIAAGRGTRGVRLASAVLAALYFLAIGLAGLWLVLPWWLAFVYPVLLLAVASRAFLVMPKRERQSGLARSMLPMCWLASLGLSIIIVVALVARRPPSVAIELAFPLQGGTYLVVNGGNHQLVNAHLGTLEGDRFRPYRGQSYGVDLVRIDRVGLRARGLLPNDASAYLIFGDTVVAPCAGRVVATENGAPDMSPPQPDRSHMAGNYVMLDCGGTWVLLGHLQQGSVAVREGDAVGTGVALGRVGNSGNTGEPHLHIHAQGPGTKAEPMSGEPLAMRIDGRYLARNARVTVSSGEDSVRRPTAAASSMHRRTTAP